MKTFTGQKKDAVGSAGRVIQYCQLECKSSHAITRDIWDFLLYLEVFLYLFYDFFFRGTLAGKHCCNVQER
jgi:hypothetical protein